MATQLTCVAQPMPDPQMVDGQDGRSIGLPALVKKLPHRNRLCILYTLAVQEDGTQVPMQSPSGGTSDQSMVRALSSTDCSNCLTCPLNDASVVICWVVCGGLYHECSAETQEQAVVRHQKCGAGHHNASTFDFCLG